MVIVNHPITKDGRGWLGRTFGPRFEPVMAHSNSSIAVFYEHEKVSRQNEDLRRCRIKRVHFGPRDEADRVPVTP